MPSLEMPEHRRCADPLKEHTHISSILGVKRGACSCPLTREIDLTRTNERSCCIHWLRTTLRQLPSTPKVEEATLRTVGKPHRRAVRLLSTLVQRNSRERVSLKHPVSFAYCLALRLQEYCLNSIRFHQAPTYQEGYREWCRADLCRNTRSLTLTLIWLHFCVDKLLSRK